MILLFILLQFVHFVLCCDRGLTQLRHRETLELMRCVPTISGQPDPCIVLTGGRMAWCQQDERDWICCGTQELLIQILAGKPAFRAPQDHWANFHSTSQYDYNVVVDRSIEAATPLVVTTPGSMTVAHRTTTRDRIAGFSSIEHRSTLLSMLTFPFEERGNLSASLRLSSNVISIQDGRCQIVVNTGMPHQKDEILKNMDIAEIRSRDVQFVVVTSPFAPFVGNLNLFQNAQMVIEKHFLYKEHMIKGGVEENVHLEICSPNTYIVSTPGPSKHSVTVIARNVPSMGTVAIAGALFPKDDVLMNLDEDFTEDAVLTMKSRRKIICQVDWIVPAYSVSFPVTSFMRRQAECDENNTY